MTFKQFLKVLSYIFTALVLLSCNKGHQCDCVKSTGDITKENRTIMDFNKISVTDNINLYITQDTFYAASVEAGSHLLKSIKTDVRDSCLYLSNENKCNWVRSFKDKVNIYVTCKKIKELVYTKGSGNISSTDTLYADYFQLDDYDGSGIINLKLVANTSWFNLHTGPADLYVAGRSGVSYLYSAGNGKADLRNFPSGYFFINNSSTNDCYINVYKEMELKIGYIGNIYYYGSPYKITANITGSGKLIKI
jgi:hypothetical protein